MHEIRRFFSPAVFHGSNFQVKGMGVLEEMPAGHLVDRPSKNDVMFMLIHEDPDRLSGHMMVWKPENWHYYGGYTHKWLHSWLHIDGNYVHSSLSQQHVPVDHPIAVDPPLAQDFLKCLRDLHQECTSPWAMQELAQKYFDIFLLKMKRCKGTNHVRLPDNLFKLQQTIEKNIHQPWDLQSMAKQAGMSPSHLSTQFKKYFNSSPVKHLTSIRMQQAVFLLQSRNMRVGEVAVHVGYEDISHFSKAFKAYHGKSPKQYTQ